VCAAAPAAEKAKHQLRMTPPARDLQRLTIQPGPPRRVTAAKQALQTSPPARVSGEQLALVAQLSMRGFAAQPIDSGAPGDTPSPVHAAAARPWRLQTSHYRGETISLVMVKPAP